MPGLGLPTACSTSHSALTWAAASARLPPCLPELAGLPSTVPEVQALALDTTCKLAAAAGPELLRPHMPLLVPAMLESLRWAPGGREEKGGCGAGWQHGPRVGMQCLAASCISLVSCISLAPNSSPMCPPKNSHPHHHHTGLPRSGLEDSRLNYIEQHAERLGLDAGRLEGARVAAAQGGPAGETLDLCARWAGQQRGRFQRPWSVVQHD